MSKRLWVLPILYVQSIAWGLQAIFVGENLSGIAALGTYAQNGTYHACKAGLPQYFLWAFCEPGVWLQCMARG